MKRKSQPQIIPPLFFLRRHCGGRLLGFLFGGALATATTGEANALAFAARTGTEFTASCPSVGGEYEQMLAKLEAIRTAVKTDANCKDVTLSVRSLSDLITSDREKVLQIVEKAPNQSLSADDSKTVRSYAENLTTKVAALNDLFTQSNYCFRGDQPEQQLGQLAAFVNEASQLVSSLSGPWGTPIALAGNIVAGYLTGLDKIMKTRADYDFGQTEQWTHYVQSLCTYFSYRDQVAHLLNPQDRIRQLMAIKVRLESPAPNSNPGLALALEKQALRDWILNEVARIRREANGYWGQAAGRYLLAQAKTDIENFLIDKEAANFIAYDVKKSLEDYGTFKNYVMNEGGILYRTIENTDRRIITAPVRYKSYNDFSPNLGLDWTNPLSYFNSLILKTLDWDWLVDGPVKEDLKYAWRHFRNEGLARLGQARTSATMTEAFCVFFRRAGLYNSRIRSQCLSETFSSLLSAHNNINNQLAESDQETPEAGVPIEGLGAKPTAARESDLESLGLTPLETLAKKLGLARINQDSLD